MSTLPLLQRRTLQAISEKSKKTLPGCDGGPCPGLSNARNDRSSAPHLNHQPEARHYGG